MKFKTLFHLTSRYFLFLLILEIDQFFRFFKFTSIFNPKTFPQQQQIFCLQTRYFLVELTANSDYWYPLIFFKRSITFKAAWNNSNAKISTQRNKFFVSKKFSIIFNYTLCYNVTFRHGREFQQFLKQPFADKGNKMCPRFHFLPSVLIFAFSLPLVQTNATENVNFIAGRKFQ